MKSFNAFFCYFRFRDTQMLQYLPIETQVLIFNGNYIDLVPNNVFGQVEEHLNLKVIDFSNNHINEITGKAFHLVSSVEVSFERLYFKKIFYFFTVIKVIEIQLLQ